MDITRRAELVLGLINLKEDIYAGRTNWTQEQRDGLTDIIRSALDAIGALDKPAPRPLRRREWPIDASKISVMQAYGTALLLKKNQDQSIDASENE